jgi:soluble lytic murein transglycosylase
MAIGSFLYDPMEKMGSLLRETGWDSFFSGSVSLGEALAFNRSETRDPAAEMRISKLRRLLSAYHTGLSSNEEETLARLIYEESLRHHYDPELIAAIILVESSFYNWSTSRKGAIGLMQIQPKTGQEMAQNRNLPYDDHHSLFEPDLNIKLGVQYLSYLHRRFGNLELALTAYNHGPTRIVQRILAGKPLPTRYSRKVLDRYEVIRQDGDSGLPPAIPAGNRS